MKTIVDIIRDTLIREGGFVDHHLDKGGPTKYGITKKTLEAYLCRPCTTNDVKALSVEIAKEIYHSNYYKKPKIYLLPNCVQEQVFDMAINHGSKQAVKLLQKAVNGFKTVIIDGVIGLQTVDAVTQWVNEVGCVEVNNALANTRIKFYEAIVRNDAAQELFFKGWLKRARSFIQNT